MTESETLDGVRRRIDDVDLQLVLVLAERQRLVEAVASIKGSADAVHDPVREFQVLEHVRVVARAAGLSPGIALPVWRSMIACFTRHQMDWLARADPHESSAKSGKTDPSACAHRPRDSISR